MVLIPTLAYEMDLKKATLTQEGWAAARRKGGKFFRCECGCGTEDGAMVGIPCSDQSSLYLSHIVQFQCGSCGAWQHHVCYGFGDESNGTRHVCYKCLLEDGNRPVLSSMEKLAQRRRALWLLYDQNCPASPKALKEGLGE